MTINVFHVTLILCSITKFLNCDTNQLDNSNNSNEEQFCFYTADKCPNAHINFWLYKKNSDNGLLLDTFNLSRRDFEPRLPLKILIHGFNGSRHLSPNREIRPVLLQNGISHVISIDYQPLVRMLCYFPWAIYNANVVSKCLAQLIDNLIAEDIYSREDIHIIGFSLGGQIAGLTANYAKTRLKHITGLDPARPAFITLNNDEKLDTSDADFVDVIHTDPLLYGILMPTGHADFYPNFGATIQAGCSYWQEGRLINCNHFRAPLYYAESISSSAGFWAYPCGSWWEFLIHRCNYYGHMPMVKMGYFIDDTASGAYFLTTHPSPPFAKGIPIEYQHEIFQDPANEYSTTQYFQAPQIKL